MAGFYDWIPVDWVFYTSKPYPLFASDSFSGDQVEEHTILGISLAEWEALTLTESYEFISATIEHKISYSVYPDIMGYQEENDPDALTENYEFLSATLTQQIGYVSYDNEYPATMTEDYEFLSATLTHVIGYVYIVQPPDNIVEDHIITGITLV